MGVGIKQCCLADPSLLITKGLIGAEWVGSDDGSTFQVENPATREVIAELPKLGSSETERAIVAAEKAFSVWKKKTAKERSSIMKRWLDLVKENVEDLAKIITLENGKPLAEAMGEMAFATDIIEFYAEEAKRIEGDVSSSIFAEKKILVLRQPVGVVGAIIAWNFPSFLATWKVCPALAAGCTMVLKPAELTPFSALALAELGLRAGFPPGVLNIVMGDAPAVGKALKDSPAVRKMAFTGSTAVGRTIMEGCAKTLKRVSLELGGNAPFIVFDDADVDLAVQGLIAAKFWNNGQVCISPNRVLVHDGVYDTFSKKLAEAVGALKVGNGFDKEVTTGPVITVQGMQKVERLVNDAVSKGAKVIAGGKRHALGGSFFEPTVLGDCNRSMDIFSEEIFGPVAALHRFHTEEEVMKIAHDTEYGLGAYFFTRDMARGWRVAEGLEFGSVGWNEPVIINEVSPFGGFKQSGLGRESSKYAIDEYLELKSVYVGGLTR